MTDDLIGQRRRERRTHAVEAFDLRTGVGVLFGHVRAVQMREDRRRLHALRRTENPAQPRQLLFGEAQTMHPRVELDVDRIAAFVGPLHRGREGFERMEAVYLGFETIGDHQREAARVGVEHHDRHRDAPLAQQNPSSANATAR